MKRQRRSHSREFKQEAGALEKIRYGQLFRIVVHGCLVGDQLIRSETRTQLRGSINALAGQLVSGAISVFMDRENDCDEAESMTLEFLSMAVTPLLESNVIAGAP